MKTFCIVAIIAFFLSIVVLFKIKLYVQSLNTELVKIKSEINLAQSDLKVLQAEWSYLNNPTRLARLARKYLRNNSLILTDQIKNLDSLQGH